jgi:DNA-binding CsgD family transcriptional regulator
VLRKLGVDVEIVAVPSKLRCGQKSIIRHIKSLKLTRRVIIHCIRPRCCFYTDFGPWCCCTAMACRQSTLRLDLNVRQAIGALLEAGASPVELARLYRCHPATVYRYRANLDLYGDVAPPPPSVQGRPRKITYRAREGMLDWLLENGDDQ